MKIKNKIIILLLLILIISLIIYNYDFKEKFNKCEKNCKNNDECAIGLTCKNECCI